MSALNLHGFGAFTRKELLETRKTWRLWVLPGVLVFLGLTTPIMAAVTPTILKMTAQRQPGVVIKFPTPTSIDSYAQFMGNLAQLALLVVIITGGRRNRRRAARRYGRARADQAALAHVVRVGQGARQPRHPGRGHGDRHSAVRRRDHRAVRREAHRPVHRVGGRAWLALAAMFVCLMIWLSAALDKQAAAAGAGLAAYAAIFALTGFPAIREWTPAGILAANDALLKGKDMALGRPVTVTLLLALVFLIAAAWAFRRKEL